MYHSFSQGCDPLVVVIDGKEYALVNNAILHHYALLQSQVLHQDRGVFLLEGLGIQLLDGGMRRRGFGD